MSEMLAILSQKDLIAIHDWAGKTLADEARNQIKHKYLREIRKMKTRRPKQQKKLRNLRGKSR